MRKIKKHSKVRRISREEEKEKEEKEKEEGRTEERKNKSLFSLILCSERQ